MERCVSSVLYLRMNKPTWDTIKYQCERDHKTVAAVAYRALTHGLTHWGVPPLSWSPGHGADTMVSSTETVTSR